MQADRSSQLMSLHYLPLATSLLTDFLHHRDQTTKGIVSQYICIGLNATVPYSTPRHLRSEIQTHPNTPSNLSNGIKWNNDSELPPRSASSRHFFLCRYIQSRHRPSAMSVGQPIKTRLFSADRPRSALPLEKLPSDIAVAAELKNIIVIPTPDPQVFW